MILAPFAHLPMMQLVALVVLACLPFVGKAASHIDVVQSITTDGRCQFFHTFEMLCSFWIVLGSKFCVVCGKGPTSSAILRSCPICIHVCSRYLPLI